ncbi:hypothetical protein PHYBLDRAFT_173321 [Phycomyces blakesleeanus NRRL 1555(-)]|uniref:DDE-1 domain-containing protein n=1 Tax=Phycomyces blakesleeanus (strain ATCC 8743b / DSM 1359 / FGSC 10004 / NBRC 33097 / NRRL 1555) TaxID=763407 RepID=A0A167KKT5_PHYB8|nr:hypothetical protein PHYBLDRAFT_173321 [Phycomyces blakesleeanus NRRL 1555(-)]OAD68319.1 hypothetical protein PHYBLDRAFT_173321 [Phycomyces blakesleeanus NRRL 1555(-)]|eukprot:XP_018286359.1 hypothetical protein PHYBLDRAFT_173321 [Phycomyces blakesleeanus NRRL 1555(-)]
MHGKSSFAPKDTKGINLRVEEIKKKLRMYERKDIFNFDKTGLFYKQPPISTISTAAISGPEHSFQYYHNDKSWIACVIFRDICKIINHQVRNLGRKILVLLDNAACHNTHDNYTNVKFLYLPSNTTLYLQPLDTSFIQNFKVKYQHYQYTLATQRYISNMIINPDDYFKLSQLEVMNFTSIPPIISETVNIPIEDITIISGCQHLIENNIEVVETPEESLYTLEDDILDEENKNEENEDEKNEYSLKKKRKIIKELVVNLIHLVVPNSQPYQHIMMKTLVNL